MAHIFNSTEVRRELHPLAELGVNTKNTAQYVLQHLKDAGVDAQMIGETNGVMGVIDSGAPGPVIMFRADMDALPFEVDGKPCAVHACGHDAHTAMLIEAASRLVGKIKRGKLRFLFQPAEETLEGAPLMIKNGVLDDVDIIIGAHVRPLSDLPVGWMSPAVKHTSSCPIEVVIHGRTAHASRPHLGLNVISVGTAIVNAVAQIHLDPAANWSLKPTRFVADDGAFNIIPHYCRMGFDTRAETNELMSELLKQFERAVKGAAAMYGAEAEIRHEVPCPAANLDDDTTAEVIECMKDVVGEEKIAAPCGGGGEDFHFYKIAKPSLKNAYFGVGAGVTPGLHKVNMTMDDTQLPKGADVFVAYALKKLG